MLDRYFDHVIEPALEPAADRVDAYSAWIEYAAALDYEADPLEFVDAYAFFESCEDLICYLEAVEANAGTLYGACLEAAFPCMLHRARGFEVIQGVDVEADNTTRYGSVPVRVYAGADRVERLVYLEPTPFESVCYVASCIARIIEGE